MRVLVVDDNTAFVESITDFLSMHYTAEGFDSPVQALAAFCDNPFDAVVTDLDMPGMTGLALADEINKVRPGTPVIIATGSYDCSACLASPLVKQVLNKPFSLTTLRISLASLVPQP